jgi:hypothetical protein
MPDNTIPVYRDAGMWLILWGAAALLYACLAADLIQHGAIYRGSMESALALYAVIRSTHFAKLWSER